MLDDFGWLLATRTFPTDAAGYNELLTWAQGSGGIAAFGVESTGSYAAGLARHLCGAGIEVLEVNQPHAHTRAGAARATRSTPRCPRATCSPPAAR